MQGQLTLHRKNNSQGSFPWCKVKLIYGDFYPGRSQIFNFPLHRLGKFPGIFFTGAGSNDPAPNGFVLLHLQKTINKYIDSQKIGFGTAGQKWSNMTKISSFFDPFSQKSHCFAGKNLRQLGCTKFVMKTQHPL